MGYGSGQVIETMQGIFGLEHLGGGSRLTEMVGTGKFAEMLTQIRNSGGLAQRTAATLQDNYRGWEEQLRGSITTLQIFAGTLILPAATEGARRLTAFVNRVTEFAQAHPALVRTAVLLSGVAAAALGIAGPVMLVGGALTSLAGRGLGAVALLGRGLLVVLGPIGAIAAAVAGLGYAGYWVWEHWADLTPALAGLWTELADVAAGAWGAVVELLGFDPVEQLRPYWEPVAGWFGRMWIGIAAGSWRDVGGTCWRRRSCLQSWPDQAARSRG